MTVQSRRTFTLAEDQAEFVDRLVESGRYESVEEVISAGIEALAPEQERIERWLRTEVVEAYDEMKAHPKRAIPIKEAFDAIRRRHRQRIGEE